MQKSKGKPAPERAWPDRCRSCMEARATFSEAPTDDDGNILENDLKFLAELEYTEFMENVEDLCEELTPNYDDARAFCGAPFKVYSYPGIHYTRARFGWHEF